MLINNRLEATDRNNYLGRMNTLAGEAAALLRMAHQYFMTQQEELAVSHADDALDRAQTLAGVLSSGEDGDIIHEAFTLGSRRLLYVTINYPRQVIVLASVELPSLCYFCQRRLEYGHGEVRHMGYICDGHYTTCSGCGCTYHAIYDTAINSD